MDIKGLQKANNSLKMSKAIFDPNLAPHEVGTVCGIEAYKSINQYPKPHKVTTGSGADI